MKPIIVAPPKPATQDQINCIKQLNGILSFVEEDFEQTFILSMVSKVENDFGVYLSTRQSKALNRMINKYRSLSLIT